MTGRARAIFGQVFRRALQLGVLVFVVWAAFGGAWRNYKVAHNNSRLVGLIEGESWGAAYDYNERLLSFWDEPFRASFDFLGMPWAATVFGVATVDPIMVLSHAATSRSFTPDLWIAALTPVALAAVLGKFFCSHLCPARFAFEVAQLVRSGLMRLGIALPHRRLKQRFGGWVLLGGLLAAAFSSTAIWLFVLPYVGIVSAIFLAITGGTATGLLLVPLAWFVFDALVAPGFFCHNVCPQGFLLEQMARVAPWRLLQTKADECPSACHACEKTCPYSLSPRNGTHRPACNNCGMCSVVCPKQKLGRRFSFGPAARRVLPVVTALALVLLPAASAFAHHNKGLPHYGYYDNYPQVPTEESISIQGRWEMGGTVFNFQGYDRRQADTPNDVKFFMYLYDLEADEHYEGPVDFEIRRDDEIVARFSRDGVDEEKIYSTRETLPESGDYDVVAHIRDPSRPGTATIYFPIDLGDRPVNWGVVAAITIPVLVLFALAGLGRTRRARAKRMKTQPVAAAVFAVLLGAASAQAEVDHSKHAHHGPKPPATAQAPVDHSKHAHHGPKPPVAAQAPANHSKHTRPAEPSPSETAARVDHSKHNHHVPAKGGARTDDSKHDHGAEPAPAKTAVPVDPSKHAHHGGQSAAKASSAADHSEHGHHVEAEPPKASAPLEHSRHAQDGPQPADGAQPAHADAVSARAHAGHGEPSAHAGHGEHAAHQAHGEHAGMKHFTTTDGQTVMVMGGIPPWLLVVAVVLLILGSFVIVERIGKGRGSSFRFNLIRRPKLYRAIKNRWLQAIPQLFAVVAFAFIVYAGLGGSRYHNIAPVAVWTLWWAGLIFAVVILGPVFCFACPWDGLANLMTRLRLAARVDTLSFGLQVPSWLRNMWPAIGLFVLLTWAELGLGITSDPRGTAYMGIGMAALAVGFALTFEKKAFCAHLCPVGRITGIYSNFAPVEVRARNEKVCAKCTTEDCLHGNDRGYACPTGLSLKVLDNATYCTGCTECIKSCDKNNVALNVRPFAADMDRIRLPRLDESWLCLSLLALTLFHGFTMTTAWENFEPGSTSLMKWMTVAIGTPSAVNFTVGMVLALAVPVGLYWGSCRAAAWWAGGGVSARTLFLQYSFTLLPVALFYHLAHNAMHLGMEGAHIVPLLSDPFGTGADYFGTASRSPGHLIGERPLWYIQVGLILVGHVFGIVVAHRISRRLYEKIELARRSLVPLLLVMVLLSAAGLSLMALDMNMRVGRM